MGSRIILLLVSGYGRSNDRAQEDCLLGLSPYLIAGLSLTPGEHFRCSWRVPPIVIDKQSGLPIVRTHVHVPLPNEPAYGGQGGSGWTTPIVRPEDGGKCSEASSIRSGKSTKSPSAKSPAAARLKKVPSQASFDMSTLRQAIPGPGPEIPHADPDAGVKEEEKVTVVFLCEQTSHHPPVSAAYYYCPEKGIEAAGVDQIAAKVSFPSESRGGVRLTSSC